jgi:hypothetical protein|tara:strand:- start:1630 stop:1752 length:123 start_codon:yes stop_codon:yes gene_type:complete
MISTGSDLCISIASSVLPEAVAPSINAIDFFLLEEVIIFS